MNLLFFLKIYYLKEYSVIIYDKSNKVLVMSSGITDKIEIHILDNQVFKDMSLKGFIESYHKKYWTTNNIQGVINIFEKI
jgi:hypothetical protein